MTCTELEWGGGLALAEAAEAISDLSTEVERCIEMREPDEDRSADEQRVGSGGRPVEAEAAATGEAAV